MADPEPWDGMERRHPTECQEQRTMQAEVSGRLAHMDGKLDAIVAQLGALSAAQAALDSRLRVAEVGLAEVRARQQDASTPRPPSQWPGIVSAIVAALALLALFAEQVYEKAPTP